MKKVEYLSTQSEILAIGEAVTKLNLDGFLAEISKCEAIAPMLDPTMYRKAADNLQSVKILARTLQPVQTAFNDLFSSVIKTAARGDMELPPKNG
jgi:hypothetical protein